MHLDEHSSTGCGSLVCQGKEGTPVIGGFAAAEHAERDRRAGINGKCLQAIEVVVDALRIQTSIFASDFKDASVQLSHDADQLLYFLPGRQATGDRLTLRGLV